MKTVAVSHRIRVPVKTAWEIVRTGDGLERWIPVISSCRLEGRGVGAKRVCTVNGQQVVESLETVDDGTRLLQYRIQEQALMPIRNALGTVHLTPTGGDETAVLWMMNFEIDVEAAWPAVKDGMTSMYQAAIEGLEAHARKGHAAAM